MPATDMFAGWVALFILVAYVIYAEWKMALYRKRIRELIADVKRGAHLVKTDHTGFMAYDDSEANVLEDEDDNFEGRTD